MSDRPDAAEEPVIRDKRRIDPVTGQVRNVATAASPPGGTDDAGAAGAAGASGAGAAGAAGLDAGAEVELARQLAERTADLQRVQADFANYRRRVDRDRDGVREQALGTVLGSLLPVLDDIARARTHGELEGGFKAVADALEATAAKLGLESFGAEGETFDPTVHEALTHGYSGEVDEPTAVTVFQVGYRIGARVLRPARVAVAEPDADAAAREGERADDQKDEHPTGVPGRPGD